MQRATCVIIASISEVRTIATTSRRTTSRIFSQLAEGIDEETWLFHLHRGDYSKWFREAVKDPYLADQTERVERMTNLLPTESRTLVRSLIDTRYTLPE